MIRKALTYKYSIRNPELWVGKYVRHMANWRDFQWLKGLDDNATDDYFVCEWSGRLCRACDQGNWHDYFETPEEAKAAGYDECYYYCDAGLMDMYRQSQKALAA